MANFHTVLFFKAIPILPTLPTTQLAVLFIFHMASTFLTMGLWALYVIFLVRNKALKEKSLIIWAVAIVITDPLGMIAYWFKYIW